MKGLPGGYTFWKWALSFPKELRPPIRNLQPKGGAIHDEEPRVVGPQRGGQLVIRESDDIRIPRVEVQRPMAPEETYAPFVGRPDVPADAAFMDRTRVKWSNSDMRHAQIAQSAKDLERLCVRPELIRDFLVQEDPPRPRFGPQRRPRFARPDVGARLGRGLPTPRPRESQGERRVR